MRHITIISIAVAPLLAGCAGTSLGPDTFLGPRVALNAEQNDGRAIGSLRAQLKKLNARVRRLDQRLSEQPNSRRRVTDAPARSDLTEIRQRLAELESGTSGQRQATRAPQNQPPIPSGLAQELGLINQKLIKLAVSQRSTEAMQADLHNGQRTNSNRLSREIAALSARLSKIETNQNSAPAVANDQHIAKRLAAAEASITAANSKTSTMDKALERDRKLVIEYLEDLDKRIEALENNRRTVPSDSATKSAPADAPTTAPPPKP